MSEELLNNVRVILVGTQEPMNVGAAARAMQNFGLSDLWLVNPEPQVREDLAYGDATDSFAYRLAVHSTEILDRAKVVETLPEAVADVRLVVGTTVRERYLYTGPVVTARPMAASIAQFAPQGKAAIVFGREASGLTTDELDLSQLVVRIPTSPKQSSLNLAQAVLLLGYEVFNAILNPPEPLKAQVAERDSLERLFKDLEEFTLEIGFTDARRLQYTVRRFRRLLHKADLTPGEVQFLRGFLHQSRWYGRRGRGEGGTSGGGDKGA
ncbi:MAG: RNA methyltransferase [Meiothermus sp.]|nr:RNA methyltransferase [Meiothermus sp.]